jgi:hypothetical protein
MKSSVQVKSIAPHEGTQVKELHSWGEKIAATSEREWTIVLDAVGVREHGGVAPFTFPAAKRPDITVSNQTYDDMNLVAAKASTIEIGEKGVGPIDPPWKRWLWLIITAPIVLVAAIVTLIIVLARRKPADVPQQVRARDVFKMPEHVDGFVVVRLLNGLSSSPLVALSPTDQSAVRKDIEHVQRETFAPGGAGLSANELREIAKKWLARLN